MIQKTVNIGTKLDARSAAQFVSRASEYRSNVEVTIDNKTINAKSIMGIYSLGFQQNKDITISVEGSDENDAIIGLIAFLTD